MYAIELKKSALKALKKLPREISKILAKEIDSLEKDPRPHGVKKLEGNDNLYRIRKGDYRIIYQIQDKKLIVLVVLIGNRREIYRKLLLSNVNK
jgi:mRNA interferase RelE/StbE